MKSIKFIAILSITLISGRDCFSAEPANSLACRTRDINLLDAVREFVYIRMHPNVTDKIRKANICAKKIDALLLAGADINFQNEYGYSPLMWAAQSGDIDCIKALLLLGADKNLVDDRGKTAYDWLTPEFMFRTIFSGREIYQLLKPATRDESFVQRRAELAQLRDEYAKERKALRAYIKEHCKNK